MDNQHKQITGYRDLSRDEIDLMNEGKALAQQVGDWLDKLDRLPSHDGNNPYPVNATIDRRWLAIGRTQLQQGFMAATRAIAKPTTF